MVTAEQIIEFCSRVAAAFEPQRIILFGSYAYGKPTADSDVDVLVVMNYRGRELAKAVDVLETTQPDFAVDLLVRTPHDTARRYRYFDPLVREALDRGRILYDRDRPGVARQSARRLRRRDDASKIKKAQPV